MPDEISKDIEPAANAWWLAREPRTEAEGVALSIAISLKRIADAMQEPNEFGEIGGAAIAGAISRSLRDR